jgi:DNA-binding LacI/PurR family transcriptional regulator
VLGNPNRPGFGHLLNDVVKPAEAAGLDVRVLRAGNEREIESAFSTLNQGVDGILVLSDPVYANRRDQLSRLLMQHKIPAVFSSRENVGWRFNQLWS